MTGDTDADWVAVELEAGTTYQIEPFWPWHGWMVLADDTVLMLRDSKGGMIAMNDDINSIGTRPDDPANLDSSLKFRPDRGRHLLHRRQQLQQDPG